MSATSEAKIATRPENVEKVTVVSNSQGGDGEIQSAAPIEQTLTFAATRQMLEKPGVAHEQAASLGIEGEVQEPGISAPAFGSDTESDEA